MPKEKAITYNFAFSDKRSWNYVLKFDEQHKLISTPSNNPKPWTKLDYCKCSHCPLDSKEHPQCPVAKNIDEIVEDSKDVISYTEVEVTVTCEERTYLKKCAAQNGLVSLFGLIMASSACPHLEWLRPLARFHLPFASIEETLFRALSLQLLREFFLRDEKSSEASAIELKTRYAAVGTVNHCFIQRIRNYCNGDADKNAIAALDVWVQAFELFHEDQFSSLKKYF